jgi:hypothetical protein
MASPNEGGEETKIIFCNTCKVFTKHLLRARYGRPALNYEVGYVSENYERRACIWSCAGCDEETFERQVTEKSDADDELLDYFPAREEDLVRRKFFQNLNPDLKRLYEEVVACLNGGHLLLCTIGLRALIEGVCTDKGVDGKNLEHKVNGLIKFLPSLNIIEGLHTLRITGNDAAHRREPLTRDDARTAVGVMEDLLNFLYDLDYKASRVTSASRIGSLKSIKPGSVQ